MYRERDRERQRETERGRERLRERTNLLLKSFLDTNLKNDYHKSREIRYLVDMNRSIIHKTENIAGPNRALPSLRLI